MQSISIAALSGLLTAGSEKSCCILQKFIHFTQTTIFFFQRLDPLFQLLILFGNTQCFFRTAFATSDVQFVLNMDVPSMIPKLIGAVFYAGALWLATRRENAYDVAENLKFGRASMLLTQLAQTWQAAASAPAVRHPHPSKGTARPRNRAAAPKPQLPPPASAAPDRTHEASAIALPSRAAAPPSAYELALML